MKILVVGGGGREHAIIKKLKESKKVEKIFALPGNGGISADAECVNIKATDIGRIIRVVTEKSNITLDTAKLNVIKVDMILKNILLFIGIISL